MAEPGNAPYEGPGGKALAACELYYEQHKSQKETARLLGVSPSTVSRLLQQARDEGLVRISLCPPPETVLSRSLQARLASWGVRDVLVAGHSTAHVGHAAARFFETPYRPRLRVVLDGGEDRLANLWVRLPRRPREQAVDGGTARAGIHGRPADEQVLKQVPEARGRFLAGGGLRLVEAAREFPQEGFNVAHTNGHVVGGSRGM